MQAISDLKEQAVVDTPLIVFDCTLSNGQTDSWSTHAVTVGQTAYAARVLRHSAFDIQTASDQGVDGSPLISIVLANADSHFSEIEQSCGWKGAALTVSFLFYDLRNNVPLTDAQVVFQGVCNPPDQIQEATFRLTANNRMNLQRLVLPEVRIQCRCPWTFPSTLDQRTEAMSGGADGKYSMYYRCGYSPDVAGGCGAMNGSAPYTTCGYTRPDCQARGMFTRFGGLEFVPPAIAVRGYGKDWTTSNLSINQARYNDYVPMVYGTAWYFPEVVFARNDGNLTRLEVLLGIGQMQGVLTVLVSGVQIPLGINGQNMTATGWYNVETLGTRDGCRDPNFTDASGNPAGDPYGSMAYLSVVVPNQLNNGNSLPSVQVLAQGLLVPVYGPDGTYISDQFSSNPAWALLDVLRRSGWAASEIDLVSFAQTAAYCDEAINVIDPNGNTISLPRFQCNLVLQNRRTAGDLVRGIRNCARLYLTYTSGGALQLNVENTVALQMPLAPAGSNSTEQLNGGWPAYEFGDGSTGVSGILRKTTGEPTVTLTSRSIADTPNRMTVEFQDALNGYQQDSYEMVDPDDLALVGQQVSATLMAVGLPHYDQAARILKFNLDKTIYGNTCIQFQTSVKVFGVRPGDIITVTYQKEGFNRQPFRVSKISPSTNYRTTTITAHIHDDAWYGDTNGQVTSGTGTNLSCNAATGVPRPLVGSVLDAQGNLQFGVEESATTNSDGTIESSATVSFVPPAIAVGVGPGTPLLALSPAVGTGGTLKGGQTLYYAVSGENAASAESALSFVVCATVVSDTSTVTLTGLSFATGTTAFSVYRGATPAQLFRIASNQALAAQFADTGLADQLVAPPDSNFDHANFYWRRELQPEMPVTSQTANSLSNNTLQMAVNGYAGMTVRITRGTGAGQEYPILANTATSVTVSPPWIVEPDATSFFVIAEAGWHFAAITQSSPVQFAIPNRSGELVQITGRSANVNNAECAPGLCLVTRWAIGGSGAADTQVPPQPFFGMGPGTAGGTAVLSGVSFTDLTNTSSISSGTLTLYYWDELLGTPTTLLAGAMGSADQTLSLSAAGPGVVGSTLQIDAEILRVTAVANGGAEYSVTRGIDGTTAATHAASAPIYHLASQTVIAPFPANFFGSPYCGNWSYPVTLPDARMACAELFVTNDVGNSVTAGINLTHNDDNGLRTLSGGQYSIQVDGYLAVQQPVAPPIVLEASHAVRDIYAVLGTAADAVVQVQVNLNGALYCALTFPAGATMSSSVNGNTLPPLTAGAQLTGAVTSVGQTNPGANLTVLIRL